MAFLPNFLPPLLNLDGEWKEILNKLYRVFEKDFKKRKLFYQNLRVIYDNRKNSNNIEEAFWHLVTKKNKKHGRLIDYNRAKRLPWVRPIIENYNNPEINDFNYLEGFGGIRKYLWLENYDFVVILEKKINKEYIILVTDFYVDYNWKKKDLERKYQKRIENCI